MWYTKKVKIFEKGKLTNTNTIETEVNDFLAKLSYEDVLEIKPYGKDEEGIIVVYREKEKVNKKSV